MEQVLSFTNPHPVEASGLYVFFVPSRTSIESFRVSGLPEGATVKHASNQHAFDLRWDGTIPCGTVIAFSITLEGEPLVPAQALWRDGEGSLLKGLKDAAGLSDLMLDAFGALDEFTSDAIAKLFTARCAGLQAHRNHRVARYGKFFCDLDRYTNPDLLPMSGLSEQEYKDRMEIVWKCEKLLLQRLHQRRRNEPLSKPMDEMERRQIRQISRLLLDLYREGLDAGTGEIDPEELWTAFEMFANGELRVPEDPKFPWNAEPNGAALFCFAEFGFLAFELGFDVKEWKRVLPSHVAIQRIFASAYRPDGALLFANYVPPNWAEEKQVGPRFKAELRARFWDMPVDELAVAARMNLQEALAHEPR